jgi:hypothetical protein
VREDNGNVVQPLELCEFDAFDFAAPLTVSQNGSPQFREKLVRAIAVFRDSLLCREPESQQLCCKLCVEAWLSGRSTEQSVGYSSRAAVRSHCAGAHKLSTLASSSAILSVIEMAGQLSRGSGPASLPSYVRRLHYQQVLGALKPESQS